MKNLKKEIRILKREMIKMTKRKKDNLLDKDVLAISQKLDEKIVKMTKRKCLY